MAGKYPLHALLGAEPEAKLKHILATIDIDYAQVTSNATKETTLANILNSLHSSRKIILFKHLIESNFAIDQQVIQEQNIEKNIEKFRVIALITKKIVNSIIEEAINQYLNEEQLKHLLLAVSELRRRYEREKDERLQVAYAAEIQRMLTDEKLQNHLKALQQSYLDRIKEHDEHIEKLQDKIYNIKNEKHSTLNDSAQLTSEQLIDRRAEGTDIYIYKDVISSDKRHDFIKDFLNEYYRAERNELKRYLALDKTDQNKVDAQLPSLINYQLARSQSKSIHELSYKEPNYEQIFHDVAKKHNATLTLLTPAQIQSESAYLAQQLQPAVKQLLDGKKQKIRLREECAHIEMAKQREKIQLQTLKAKLDLPAGSVFNKSPAALDFDAFLSTVEIKPKVAMR